MKIYVCHSRDFDFRHELYKPIEESALTSYNEFILPHKESDSPYDSRKLFESKKLELVIAEVSYPSTPQGIELGWANMMKIPIMCIYKKGSKVSRSLSAVTQTIIEYSNTVDMVRQIDLLLKGYA